MTRLRVVVYTITGRQLFFRVTPKLCHECDLTVRAVERAVREEGLEDRVELVVRPWLNNVFRALAVGGWHPPVVVIGDRVHNQGTVPDSDGLRRALRAQAA